MQIATLKKATEELGVSLDDIVHYQKKGKKAIIEIDLQRSRPTMDKDSEVDVFDHIVSISEDLGIRDWSINHDHYLYGTPKRSDGKPHA